MKIKLTMCILLCSISVSLFAQNLQPSKTDVATKLIYTDPTKGTTVQEKLAALETSFGGRIGVSAINTTNNQSIQYRANERFPIQSTFKLMVVADILKKSAIDNNLLQQKMAYTKKDLVFWSPITEKRLGDSMTISELSAAAMMYSDNTATNLLVKKLGGPKSVTAFAHSIGDTMFRVDGWEPELNSDRSKLNDTSTPAAMVKSLQRLALGNILAPEQRNQLVAWMKGNTTGDARIRAGVPNGWLVADKTGAGDYGISNDIAIIWPPKSDPIVLAIYSVQNKKDAIRHDDVVASVTRMLIKEFVQTD